MNSMRLVRVKLDGLTMSICRYQVLIPRASSGSEKRVGIDFIDCRETGAAMSERRWAALSVRSCAGLREWR